MISNQLERLKIIHKDIGSWLRDSEIDFLFAEIERQRAQLKVATTLAEKILWHEKTLGGTPTYILELATEALKQIGEGE